mmetsp:Transcript_31907/g.45376  ORF Transcript_31907/g.45376 Transcript_31907/m.45376 type:complete len:366 (-) Transcript_31907:176-1273(-)|eukprot:CAMPEP_0202446098 /NCGR_PEP_ID=MMETSP1360-20130828/4727_1 /ASSEMBLY_ACC=CAM_ASM_000848 /TAXON_ID=515479 /ORGANISM="Licmophora paradoxa, Strain CCMP2313" /LENGTH=365 /DNA_ID=CAMNT_0049062531 /DNA_START=43 /DNA_END=1140 /DNA_ORIENTATION=-
MKSHQATFFLISLGLDSICAYVQPFGIRRRSQTKVQSSPEDWEDAVENAGDKDWESVGDWSGKLKANEEVWANYASSADNGDFLEPGEMDDDINDEEANTEVWLDTLASISAEDTAFIEKENERANKAQTMQQYGFDENVVANTFDVATDAALEQDVSGMQAFRDEVYEEDVDVATVESHSGVELDPETDEPIRTQMVYVDEHTCIGCTNCAMIAQNTFFMEDEYGRARVFEQWGDDDETIQIAIETCPVDCIHYVPYDELVRLEKDRRGQVINFKARLVSQAEYGGVGFSTKVGAAVEFSGPQLISGNMGSRCNNCPSRGCKSCPMYGVGKNPYFEKKEKERKEKAAKRKLEQERQMMNKSADL